MKGGKISLISKDANFYNYGNEPELCVPNAGLDPILDGFVQSCWLALSDQIVIQTPHFVGHRELWSMATINKLAILGIRSFGQEHAGVIE